jgi:hypothetical protein
MSQAQQPTITVQDVDALVTGATPQFSLQILERVRALVAHLPEEDPVRQYAQTQERVLERIALGTTRGTRALGAPDQDDAGWDQIPSRPHGGIAPGFTDSGH